MSDSDSRPIPRSVYYTTMNMLKILAQHGDKEAIASLERMEEEADEVELSDEESNVELIMQFHDGSYLVTQHGATHLPADSDRT